MNRCANFKTNGCDGTSERGNIYCVKCLELKKTLTKNRKDHLDELLEKVKKLEEELQNIRLKHQYEKEELIKKYEAGSNKDAYNKCLEDENVKLVSTISAIRKELDSALKEKNNLEMKYTQLKLDHEKVLADLDVKKVENI